MFGRNMHKNVLFLLKMPPRLYKTRTRLGGVRDGMV